MTHYSDPMDSASNPEQPANTVYGQCKLDAFYCVLQKGAGVVEFNPDVHPMEQRRTCVKLDIQPLSDMGLNFPIQRQAIVESAEWGKIIWPSLKALNVANVREVNNAWVLAEMVSTGRQYTNRNGEQKEATQPKFLAIYPNEAACRAAYLAAHPEKAGGAPAHVSTTAATTAANTSRETALKFLPALVKKSGGTEAGVAAALAQMPMIGQHFSITSPEVQAAMMAYQFDSLPGAGQQAA